jgi:hypothetical protein
LRATPHHMEESAEVWRRRPTARRAMTDRCAVSSRSPLWVRIVADLIALGVIVAPFAVPTRTRASASLNLSVKQATPTVVSRTVTPDAVGFRIFLYESGYAASILSPRATLLRLMWDLNKTLYPVERHVH